MCSLALYLCRCVSTIGLSVLLVGVCFTAAPLNAQDQVVRVEEEWELVVATPDVVSNSPQVVCTMTPTGRLDGLYMTFELNHRSTPDYVAGGLNMLVWSGERHVTTKMSADTHAMATAAETVRWTQAMQIQDGHLIFEIINGSSVTWGNFGADGAFKAAIPSSRTSIDAYTPAASVKNSGVTFASSCVHKLTLKSVRYYRADGTVQVDATPRVVFDAAPVAP